MQKYILAACLMTGNLVFSAGPIHHQPGSLLTLSELKGLSTVKLCDCDIVVLRDGQILRGQFNHLPSLQYSFGKVSFDSKDVVVAAYIQQGEAVKMQFITQTGLSYVGNLPKDPFILLIKNNDRPGQDSAAITIAPSSIDYIIFRQGIVNAYSYREHFYNLELKNGDQFPVQLASEKIQVSDGWKSRSLLTRDILEFNFYNGLQGHILENGQRKELSFSLVKDKYLNLQLPDQEHIVKIPWNQVAKLQISRAQTEESEVNRYLADLQENLPINLHSSTAAELVSAVTIEGLDAIENLTAQEGSIGFSKADERKTEPQALFSALESFDAESEFVFADPASERYRIVPEEMLAYAEVLKNDHESFESKNLQGSLGALLIEPQAIDSLEVSDALAFSDPVVEEGNIGVQNLSQRKSEPLALFSVLDTFDLPADIAFIDEKKASQANDYQMKPEEVLTIADMLNNQNLAKVVVDPETFDVPPLEEDESSEEGAFDFAALDKKRAGLKNRAEIAYFNSKKNVRSSTGGAEEAPAATAPSSEMKRMEGFAISTNFVTNEEYQRFVQATGHRIPSHWIEGKMPADQLKIPVVNVSYYDAATYAAWCGRRLPTQTEWQRAVSAHTFTSVSSPATREWTATRDGKENYVVELEHPERKQLVKPDHLDSFTSFRCASDY